MPLFFDTETDGLFSHDPAAPPPNLHCICVYDSHTNVFTRFYEPTGGAMLPETVQAAATFLLRPDPQTVHGFNSAAYDLRLIFHHAPCPRIKSQIAALALEHTDVMLDFWSRQGFPASLAALAAGIGAGSKLMKGHDAIQKWNDNRIDDVLAYCDGDCKLLADIVAYVHSHGRFIRTSKSARNKCVTVVDNYILRTTIPALEAALNLDTSWMDHPPTINIDWALDYFAHSQ